jgi:hypothetical protein
MSDGIKMILVAIGAGLGTYIGITLSTTLCANTTGWNALVIFMFCTMFPVSIAIAGVILVLKLVQNV